MVIFNSYVKLPEGSELIYGRYIMISLGKA